MLRPISNFGLQGSLFSAIAVAILSTAASAAHAQTSAKIESSEKELQQITRKLTASAARPLSSDAVRRKALMLELARSNPRGFLANAISERKRKSLPAAVKAHVEKETTVRGKLQVMYEENIAPPPGQDSANAPVVHYSLSFEREKLDLFFPSLTTDLEPGTSMQLSGYRLEDAFVPAKILSLEKPVKVASTGEALGDQKVLFILLNANPLAPPPITPQDLRQEIFGGWFQQYYREQSYGRTSFSGDVTDWIPVSADLETASCFTLFDDQQNLPEVIDYLTSRNVDLSAYGRLAFLMSTREAGGACSSVGRVEHTYNGRSFHHSIISFRLPSQTSWKATVPFSITPAMYYFAHEMGHSLGLYHANRADCGSTASQPPCTRVEYGNYFDAMGSPLSAFHFNAFYKDLLGWIPDSEKLRIGSSGRYTLNPLEMKSGKVAALIYNPALLRPERAATSFYLEYRQPVGFDHVGGPINPNGLMINLVASEWGEDFNSQMSLLLTPDVSDKSNPFLRSDQKLVDPGRGLTIGPIISSSPTAITFDVQVTTPQCIPALPRVVAAYYNEVTSTPTKSGAVTLEFVNDNTDGCMDDRYRVELRLPAQWNTSTQSPVEFRLSPSLKKRLVFQVNGPESTSSAVISAELEVTHIGTGMKTVVPAFLQGYYCRKYDFNCDNRVDGNDLSKIGDLWREGTRIDINLVTQSAKTCRPLGEYLGDLWRRGIESVPAEEITRIQSAVRFRSCF